MRLIPTVILTTLALAACEGGAYSTDLSGDYVLDGHPGVTLRIQHVDPEDRYRHTYRLCREDACADGEMLIELGPQNEGEVPVFQGEAMADLRRDVMAETMDRARVEEIFPEDDEAPLDLFRSNGQPYFRISSMADTSFRRTSAPAD